MRVDEDAVARVGECAVFDTFVAAESPALLRLAWGLTGDRGGAEDLVQAALERVWRRWGQVRDKERAGAYARRVTVSMFLTSRRRLWWGERITALPPDAAVDDDTEAIATRQAVLNALSTLPARQRAVLILRYLDDRSEAQTADALGCSPGTVKSHTARALAALRANSNLLGLSFPAVEGKGND